MSLDGLQTCVLSADSDEFIGAVRAIAAGRVASLAPLLGEETDLSQLSPGKMLRTSMAARIFGASECHADRRILPSACAAVELVHTASLCHDDVIDNALIRRARPTLWRSTGPSTAILIGDILLCEAMHLITEVVGYRYVPTFLDKIGEVCRAEAEQELRFRGKAIPEETCLRLARSKTGPLFAFVGHVCGGENPALARALEEAGYRLGTAYQVADDLLDVASTEDKAGKTLGTDRQRGKHTLVQNASVSRSDVIRRVRDMLSSAGECVSAWPTVQNGIEAFIALDFEPAIAKQVSAWNAQA
ncbi:MAG: hypothetical protein A3K19_32265 [Lentisphaerae bacterium RIFOXYB12_FULL_65_16]|nr:MAG: hypothetical protein A3K18_17810 [Lentisphaerae bacterium RIFOXYA12_64_32]OGV90136.1 MAG: hypothetical protein A3K19_32265 [Lentisphaerae bacterium RIFOXYB12_FULL_65_16]